MKGRLAYWDLINKPAWHSSIRLNLAQSKKRWGPLDLFHCRHDEVVLGFGIVHNCSLERVPGTLKPHFHQTVQFNPVQYTLERLFLCFHYQKLGLVTIERLFAILFFHFTSVAVPSTLIRYEQVALKHSRQLIGQLEQPIHPLIKDFPNSHLPKRWWMWVEQRKKGR